MPTQDYSCPNLVFEGGGAEGVAYDGVFGVLERRQITPQIESGWERPPVALHLNMMSLN